MLHVSLPSPSLSCWSSSIGASHRACWYRISSSACCTRACASHVCHQRQCTVCHTAVPCPEVARHGHVGGAVPRLVAQGPHDDGGEILVPAGRASSGRSMHSSASLMTSSICLCMQHSKRMGVTVSKLYLDGGPKECETDAQCRARWDISGVSKRGGIGILAGHWTWRAHCAQQTHLRTYQAPRSTVNCCRTCTACLPAVHGHRAVQHGGRPRGVVGGVALVVLCMRQWRRCSAGCHGEAWPLACRSAVHLPCR